MRKRTRDRIPHDERIRRLKAHYGDTVKTRQQSLRWAVIDCYFRYGLSVPETANVLGVTEESVESQVDTIRQDAR